ncbi:MAG: S49 family peptidase [Nitratireductor sp.]
MEFRKLIPSRFRKGQTVIPVVRLSGAIMASGSPLRQNLSLAGVAPALERAFSMKRAPAVALSINSPGGSPVQSRLIYSRIRELAEKHEKQVLVFVEDVAASGGYMIALAGDEIIADETSIVGSIGVVAATFGFDKAIAKLGVERRVYTAGKNKVMLDPFQPEKERDIEHLKALQLEIHQVFIDMVKARRGARLADSDDLFTGMFWTGAKGRELGLVDGCGLMAPILRERFGTDTELKLVTQPRSLFGRAQPGVSADLLGGAGSAMAAELPGAVAAEMEQRALWARYGL